MEGMVNLKILISTFVIRMQGIGLPNSRYRSLVNLDGSSAAKRHFQRCWEFIPGQILKAIMPRLVINHFRALVNINQAIQLTTAKQ